MNDCRAELAGLLLEEVGNRGPLGFQIQLTASSQRLTGASLLVLNNKRDVDSSMDEDDIRRVSLSRSYKSQRRADSSPQALQLDSIRTHKWKILSCSAITGANLQEGLNWVVKDAKDRLFLY